MNKHGSLNPLSYVMFTQIEILMTSGVYSSVCVYVCVRVQCVRWGAV